MHASEGMNTSLAVTVMRGSALVLAVLLNSLIPRPSVAQDRLAATVFAGAALPVGDFGDDFGEEAGLATPGVVLGGEIGVPVGPVPGLFWQSTLEGMTFGVDQDLFDEFFGDELDIDVGRYLAAVVHTGARYSAAVNPFVSVHGSAQVSLGVFKGPGATFSVAGETAELSTEWASARGYALGAGLTLNDRVELQAAYKRLINPEVNGELRYGTLVEPVEADQEVAWVQVTLGLRLR